jgi:hypothetical protein
MRPLNLIITISFMNATLPGNFKYFQTSVNFTINGKYLPNSKYQLYNSFNSNFKPSVSWPRNQFLQFFPTRFPTCLNGKNQGAASILYYFAIHNRQLSFTEQQQLYHRKFARSPTIVSNLSVSTNTCELFFF